MGPYLSLAMTMNVEIQKRIKAANANFVVFARVFTSTHTPMFGKRVLFSCLISAFVYGGPGAGKASNTTAGTGAVTIGTAVFGALWIPTNKNG